MESRRKHRLSPSVLCCFVVLCVRLQASVAGDCPADGRTWVPFGQRCFHFVHGEEDKLKSYTFETAKNLCKTSGFELLTVQSAEENDFIIEYSPEVWKGNIGVWLGMYYDPDSEDMKWFGERVVSFANWDGAPDPSDLVPMDRCAALHSTTGKWENVSCLEEVENGVICEAEQAEGFKPGSRSSPLLSALVILSVLAVVGISAAIWVLHQRHSHGASIFTGFEYHPAFGVPAADQSCLVEAEEEMDSGTS